MRRLSTLLGLPDDHPQKWLFAAFALILVGAILAAVRYEIQLLYALPAAAIVGWLAIVDFRKVFFLLLGCIPISMEANLPGGFGTDLPSEPLMWVLTLVGLLWLLRNGHQVDGRFLRHPITLALLAHLAWMTLCVVTSESPLVSIKFLAAKGWYVAVFYFLAGRMLNEERDFKNLLWWFFVPLVVAVCTVLVRHASIGFSFEEVAYAMGPFFRNHVMYACLLAIFLPFVWYGTYWYRRYSLRWWFLVLGIVLLLVGINFAFTRAAYVALVAAIGIKWCIRRRWLHFALLGAALAFTMFIAFVNHRDNWLLFAPDFERAISHKRFENLLEATTKLEDISTMERVYRWVAATYMIRERPLMGIGPGNFYFFYQKYTVSSFKTYVSDNPEHSGIHNYYLMTTVEQGLPGLFFFLLFCVVTMLQGQRIYHRTADPGRRRTLIAAILCFILIDLLMLMNDFVETDKIGSLFFLSAAVLVNMDLGRRGTGDAEVNRLRY
ncbi:MAG: O-antigen ligase family protein [Saprospiraceae bacterium]